MGDTLYRKDNKGNISTWVADLIDNNNNIVIQYGILGGKLHREIFPVVQKNPLNELNSKYRDKIKTGYKTLNEVRDQHETPPVGNEATLIKYLKTYLPDDRTTGDGTLLPMLAKTYNPNVFKKVSAFLAQWKINGLRCFITAEVSNDLFVGIHLKFQSREGEYWNNLYTLEEYLLQVIPDKVLSDMLDEGLALDGEIYLPGHTINEINHFVKTPCEQTHLLQFWCYDIGVENSIAKNRHDYIMQHLANNHLYLFDINGHLNNKEQFVVLPTFTVIDDYGAVELRDKFISDGFEGLILRNPNAEYGYGKRNANMIKFKDKKDGKFKVIDIYKEEKRNLPILLCTNDVNDETFETRLSCHHGEQEYVLNHKDKYVGKYVFVEFGERSGITRVPFHIKSVYFID